MRFHFACVLSCAVLLWANVRLVSAMPPPTAKRPVTDVYHGQELVDDYRWLEDWDDPDVKRWSDAQNVHARGFLDALPAVDAIRSRLTELETARSVEYTSLVLRDDALFALKHEPPKQQPLVVVLDDTDGERVLVDPNALDSTGGTSIDWFVPSLDGKHLAVSLSEGGSESGTVHVYAMETGRELTDDIVPRVNGGTAGGSLAWDAEGAGFFYTRYPRGDERPPEDRDFYQQVYFHRLGTATEEDTYQLGRDFPRIAEIELETSPDGRSTLVSLQNGDGGEFAHFLLSSEGSWTQVSRFEDRVVTATFGLDGHLYLVSRSGAPRGQVLRLPLDLPVLDKPSASCLKASHRSSPAFRSTPR